MPNPRAITWVILSLAMLAVIAGAQQKATPAPPSLTDVSGTYSFLREGELVELNLQDGNVIGDIQRFGSTNADRGVLLTHFFDKASLKDDRLEFTTKTVHGVYYQFKGKVERGEGKTRADEDYYRIVGTLTEFATDARKKTSARKREATFKSLPDELLEETAQESQ